MKYCFFFNTKDDYININTKLQTDDYMQSRYTSPYMQSDEYYVYNLREVSG